jgi:apolipoprotein N-acyltransferase
VPPNSPRPDPGPGIPLVLPFSKGGERGDLKKGGREGGFPYEYWIRGPRRAALAALLAGAVLPLAFAPFQLFPLAVVSPAVLFLLWRDAAPARAAWQGFLFGLGMFGVGVSWVYVSMHNFGNMPAPLAAFATLLLVAGLALYPALLGFVQAKLRRGPEAWHALLILPGLWTLFEWWRGWFLSGFPWLNLGYSQAATPLAGFAAWAGVYGASLACALSAGLIAYAASAPIKAWRLWLPLLAAIWLGGWAAGRVEWAQPEGPALRVALVQGNVPLKIKWRPEQRGEIVDRYLSLSRRESDRDLIVWPEAAMPAYLEHIAPVTAALNDISRERGTDFVFGVIEGDAASRAYYNSVVSVGRTPGAWRKQHLVPFGEFLPMPLLFRWLIDSMQIPMSNFSTGARDQPLLQAAGQRLGVTVCYEDAFGEEMIRQLPDATLLVNVSEDAWFGDSFAPHQRVQMARLRALETARPMLRAANTGPSTAIDHRGAILATTAQFRQDVLRADVQPMTGATPYVRWGNWPVVMLVLALVLSGQVRPGRK